MDDRSLPPQLVDVFLQELQEHVSSFGDALTALARSPEYAATPLANALRAMHSLKGAARTLGLGELADACHDLESIIAAVQQGRLPLDHATTRLLFDAVDLIDQMGAALGGDGEVAHDALARLKRRLEAALQQASPETAPGPLIEQPPTTPTWRDSTVRVPAHRLDELLAQCVELLSHERSVATRAADLAVLQQRLGDWRRSWWQSPYDVRGWLRHANGQRPDRPAASRAQRQGQPTAASLSEFDRQLRRLRRDLELGHWRSTQSAEMLHELVRRSRLLPFREMSQGLDRVVRDLAEAEGKRVRLVVSGEHAELDRALLVALRDAVLHLVRNAVHHGIEQPGEREAAGKAGEGRIEIAVAVRGSLVEVRVEDDGRGLDVAALRQQAQRAGIGPGEQVDVTSLIFHSGVTAASEVGAVAGRGVGLDVVHSRVESLRGTIVASHGPGEGTRFIMQIPLTLTTVSGVLVRAAGQVFAIRSALVQAVVRPVDFAEPGAVRWNGRHVPAAPLAALLRL
ncbi:MAG: ATP-binding protein, partial [Phycisphaeraceae bacterium]